MLYTPENTSRSATVYFVTKEGTKSKLSHVCRICTDTNKAEILAEPFIMEKGTGMWNVKPLYCSNILVVCIIPELPELFILFE